MKIIDFTREWIPAAEQLAIENYEEERNKTTALPESAELPSLDYLVQNGLTVAAVEGDKLLGYLGAFGPWSPVFYTQTLCGVFSPIHAHGAVRENRMSIYQRMYQAAAEKWVRAGAQSHAITFYRHDTSAQEALFIYGFGLRCMDMIRLTTEPDCESAADCTYIELQPSRQQEIRQMRIGLSDHLAQSPCFLCSTPEDIEQWLRGREANPPRIFAAERNRSIVAYIEVKEEGENFVSSTHETRNICGAYCLPECRGNNITQGLLRYILSVLRSEGISRLGVDCESFNPTALNFWTKYFDVYTHSLVRRIDENAMLVK